MPNPNHRAAVMAMVTLYVQEGLRRSLLELARLKDDAGLPWLAEFQNELVRDAKCSGVDGIPIEDEVAIMREALGMLDFIFDGIRREFAQEPKHE
jgi:hypothetical protein